MNDELMVLFYQLEYAVRTLRRRQAENGGQREADQFLLSTSEKQIDDLLLRIETLREKQRRALKACV